MIRSRFAWTLAATLGLPLFSAQRGESSPLLGDDGARALRTYSNFVLGTQFAVGSSDVTVSRIGAWNVGLDAGGPATNYVGNIQIGLWDNASTFMGSVTIPSNLFGTSQSGEFLYLPLASPVLLHAGATYKLGAYNTTNNPLANQLRDESGSTTASLSADTANFNNFHAAYTTAGTFIAPNGTTGAAAFVGPNMQYTLGNHVASAGNVISESFTAIDGTTLVGRAPAEANLPGGSFTTAGVSPYDENHVIVGNQAKIGPSTAVSTDFHSGSYTPSGSYAVSGDLTIGSTVGRGVGLGFWNNAPSGEPVNNFTGLQLFANGDLTLYELGVAGATVSFGGTFTTTSAYHLSYVINVATGQISDVTLSLSTADYAGFSSSAFVLGNLTRAGFFDTSDAGLTFGNMDNFQISAVPEPMATCFLGVAWLLLGRRATPSRELR